MALGICWLRCVFSILLVQTAITWDVRAAKHHRTNKRALLAENLNPVERTADSSDSSSLDITVPPNITQNVTDHHVYYNSTFYSSPDVAMSFWVDLSKIPDEKVITHNTLSESHRRAAGVTLSFDFPFYGHLLRKITIATGGFLYMGDHIHSWIAATQYIAPLMANFDPSLSGSSTIQYHDNGTAFTVQWDKVLLQDRSKDGSFTFQTTLLKNGDIIFVYKEMPFSILEISNDSHPVKVGCSDAYVMERTTLIFRKKVIYEYHRLDQKSQEISNKTALYLTALPTCQKYNDCKSCMNADIGFNCTWCEAVGRCSDGLDRNRQEWLKEKCSEVNDTCPTILPPVTSLGSSTAAIVSNTSDTESPTLPYETTQSIEITTESPTSAYVSTLTTAANPDSKVTKNPVSDKRKQDREENETSGIGAGGIFAIVLVVSLVVGLGIWTLYAYRNPQSSSGQFLIKYRPSQWHWKNEESHSASVHM